MRRRRLLQNPGRSVASPAYISLSPTSTVLGLHLECQCRGHTCSASCGATEGRPWEARCVPNELLHRGRVYRLPSGGGEENRQREHLRAQGRAPLWGGGGGSRPASVPVVYARSGGQATHGALEATRKPVSTQYQAKRICAKRVQSSWLGPWMLGDQGRSKSDFPKPTT